MNISTLQNVVIDYKNNTLRANAQLTKQARADAKLLDMLVADMQVLINNGCDVDVDLHTSDIDNIGIIAQHVGYLLAKHFDGDTLSRNNHTSAKFSKQGCIKTYVSSKPSAVSAESPTFTYVYYVRATFHGLVRYTSKNFIGKRLVNSDIPFGRVIKMF